MREQDELFEKNLNFHSRLCSTKSSIPRIEELYDDYKKAGSYRKILSKYENPHNNFNRKNSLQSKISTDRIDNEVSKLDSSINY